MMCVSLSNMTKKNIFNEVGFIVNNSKVKKMTPKIFGNGTPAWGLADFELRSKIIDSLVDGALVIEVHMKRLDPTEPTPPFIPDNPATCKIVQGLFLDEETADIVFEVGMRTDNEGGDETLEITIDHDNAGERDVEVDEGMRDESHGQILKLRKSPQLTDSGLGQIGPAAVAAARDERPTPLPAHHIGDTPRTVLFPAHRLILRKCSSTFDNMFGLSCGEVDGTTNATTIQIPDVSPDIFRHLLFHLYGGKVMEDDMKSHAREILDAADRYGVVDLKLEAEAYLVKYTKFSMDNLLDLLLYSDSKNCALLKEAAIDYMLENKSEVFKHVSFTDAPGSLVSDVLAAMARGEMTNDGTEVGNIVGNELMAMRICDLRWKAHRRGLSADGSREMLIAALEDESRSLNLNWSRDSGV